MDTDKHVVILYLHLVYIVYAYNNAKHVPCTLFI